MILPYHQEDWFASTSCDQLDVMQGLVEDARWQGRVHGDWDYNRCVREGLRTGRSRSEHLIH